MRNPADTPQLDTDVLRIVLMTSFARSGETLLLRSLNAHGRVLVAHQLLSPADEPAQNKTLFKALRDGCETTIRRNDPLLAHRNPESFALLVVKHAVWIHKYPMVDFVLARNPFSIVRSLRQYAIDNNEDEVRRRQRLMRWARSIDNSLIEACRTGDEAEAICRLYVAKHTAPSPNRLGILRYEDLLSEPQRQLGRLMRMLDLEWSDRLLDSHSAYRHGQLGHGNIKLWQAIRQTNFSARIDLPKRDFDMIAELCRPVLDLFGYQTGIQCLELLPLDT